MAQLVYCELTDRVWNLPGCEIGMIKLVQAERKEDKRLLEEDRNEASIEIAHATLAQQTCETRD
jgi:hypothetical protein